MSLTSAVSLPRALAAWGPDLAVFPPDIAAALAPLCQSLAMVVAPLGAMRPRAAGEWDGVDGLTQRGDYERLLHSEWLLADEVPDEFLRRAAEGELLFHRPRRRAPMQPRLSFALFDVGPDVLGSPRIAALALLVVLARRARRANARFAWGCVQASDMPMRFGLDRAGVGEWLRSRSAVRPEACAFPEVRHRVESELGSLGDVWLVGGGTLPSFWPGASRVDLEDPLEPEARIVHVEVRPKAGAHRTLTLNLPDDRLCARVLRDPFATPDATLRRSASSDRPASNLVFGAGAGSLLALTETRSLVTFTVPSSVKATMVRGASPRTADSEIILGAGRRRKNFATLSWNPELRTFRLVSGSREIWNGEPCGWALVGRLTDGILERPPALLELLLLDDRPDVFFLAQGGHLVRITESGMDVIAEGVLAARTAGNAITVLTRRPMPEGATAPGVHVAVLEAHGAMRSSRRIAAAEATGGTLMLQASDASAYAVCSFPTGLVTVSSPVRSFDLYPGNDAVVLGVRPLASPDVFVLSEGGRVLRLVNRQRDEALHRSASPIIHGTVAPKGDVLAVQTEDGELLVITASGTIRGRLRFAEPP